MKPVYVTFAVALVAAMSAVGCGSSQNNQPTSAAAVTAAAAPAPGTVAIPAGCYYSPTYSQNPGGACPAGNNSPCPQGYMLNGTQCIISSNTTGTGGCQTAWNGYGYACNTPTGYGNCPMQNGAYSQSSYGCVVPGQYNYANPYSGYQGYYCQMSYTSGYVCYYTNGAPAAGYYFNGYGWVRYM